MIQLSVWLLEANIPALLLRELSLRGEAKWNIRGYYHEASDDDSNWYMPLQLGGHVCSSSSLEGYLISTVLLLLSLLFYCIYTVLCSHVIASHLCYLFSVVSFLYCIYLFCSSFSGFYIVIRSFPLMTYSFISLGGNRGLHLIVSLGISPMW